MGKHNCVLFPKCESSDVATELLFPNVFFLFRKFVHITEASHKGFLVFHRRVCPRISVVI